MFIVPFVGGFHELIGQPLGFGLGWNRVFCPTLGTAATFTGAVVPV